MRLSLFFVLIAGFVMVSHAEVYVWKDKSGKVLYSDSPVSSEAKVLKTLKSSSSASGTTLQKSPVSNDKGMQDSDNAKVTADNAKIAEENAKVREQNCKTARNNLAGLQSNGRVFVPGTNQFASDKQRAALMMQAQQEVQTYCQ